MKKIVLIFLGFAIVYNSIAQINSYKRIRDIGLDSLHKGNFLDAKLRFDLLEPYVNKSNENEYNKILQLLDDSINNTYNRANRLKENKQYENAILEYQRLIGREKEPFISPLYAHIGYCFEMLSNKELAKSNYQLGIQHNENLSALRMARYIRRSKMSTTTEEMIKLYEKASNYYAAMDSLGVEYGRLGRLNESYKWYRKSQTDFSKYNMAAYLLDTSTYTQLSEEYKTDDPIKLLTEAADDGYAPAQYYLGLLYYFAEEGDWVKVNELKGLELLKKAAKNYRPAKDMLEKINNNY